MVKVDGGPVVPHAQAFADEINRRFGFTHIMTYPGHEPDQQHALDNFHTRDKMLALAQWCTLDVVIDHYGIDYVIFQIDASINPGQIYNREIARHWRVMNDRGGPTQNHHDHVHVSFTKTGAATPLPGSDVTPAPQEEEVAKFITTEGEGTFVTNGVSKRWVRDKDDQAGLINTGLVTDKQVYGLPKNAFEAIPTQPGGGAPTGSTKGK